LLQIEQISMLYLQLSRSVMPKKEAAKFLNLPIRLTTTFFLPRFHTAIHLQHLLPNRLVLQRLLV